MNMAQAFFDFNNLPREIRINIWNRVPLASTRHEIRTQQGRVSLVTQGIGLDLRLVCHLWNGDIRRFLMYRGPNVIHRGPQVTTRIPRMKLQGQQWDLLAARNPNSNRWQGVMIGALDWFNTLRQSYNAPILPLFHNWLQNANRLGPIVGALPLTHKNAAVNWVYQAGFILAKDLLVIQPAEEDFEPEENTLLLMAFMYNIPVQAPHYLDPETVFYPRLQDFAQQLGLLAEEAHTATIDDDPAVFREFTLCDTANAHLRAADEDVFVNDPNAPDLAHWRDFLILEVPPVNAAGPVQPNNFTVGSGNHEFYKGETWEGSVEEYVDNWGMPV
jgi:hypothetical protein